MIDLALRKKARGYFCSQLRRVVFVGRYTAISYLFLLKTQLIALSYQVSLGISFADVLLLENCLCLVLPRQRFRFKLLKIEDLLHWAGGRNWGFFSEEVVFLLFYYILQNFFLFLNVFPECEKKELTWVFNRTKVHRGREFAFSWFFYTIPQNPAWRVPEEVHFCAEWGSETFLRRTYFRTEFWPSNLRF